jgi:hypothetical protein
MPDESLNLREYLLTNLWKSTYVQGKEGGYVDPLDLTDLKFVGDKFTYGNVNENKSDPSYVDMILYTNDSDVEQTEQLSRTYEETANFSWSVTKAITHGATFSIKCPLPKKIIVTGQYSFEISTSTTNAQSDSTKQAWTVSTPIRIPAHSRVVTQVIIDKGDFDAPFTFDGEIKGRIRFTNWSYPKGHDPNIGADFEGDITEFIPGMPLPPQLSFKDGKLIFNGAGVFTGLAGISVNVKTTQYPLEYFRASNSNR